LASIGYGGQEKWKAWPKVRCDWFG